MAADELARLEFARDIAEEAGRLSLRYFRNPELQVDLKADATPVTIADREAEQLLRRRISEEFHSDGIIGEEFGEQLGTSGWRWILDPIDGTKSFIHGVPLYAVLIGAEFNGECCLGVVHLPVLGETIYAAVGHGAWHIQNNQPAKAARVSQTKSLAECLFLTSGLSGFHKEAPGHSLNGSRKLRNSHGLGATPTVICWSLPVCAEVMVDPAMNLWDAAAILPIVQEAGGTFTDWQGRPTIHAGEGIASNGLVLEELLRLMTC